MIVRAQYLTGNWHIYYLQEVGADGGYISRISTYAPFRGAEDNYT